MLLLLLFVVVGVVVGVVVTCAVAAVGVVSVCCLWLNKHTIRLMV